MPQPLLLLPAPRHLILTGGAYTPTDGRLIWLSGVNPQAMRFAARRAQHAIRRHLGFTWEIVAGPTPPLEQIALTLRVPSERVVHPQGYELSITPEGITIEARGEAGVFYGACTLTQIIQSPSAALHRATVPCLRISDRPDFPARGVMLDVSRDKVPTLETLFALVDRLAGWKINQVQLYTEHTFAYRHHRAVWAEASPFTGEDILELDAFCRERHVELVPNQNSFGHMQRWLKHPRYTPLAELTGEFTTPWGSMPGPFSLCPIDPGSLELLRSLYDELLPHFSSRLFNVGCDESFDVGQGRSRTECERRGVGRVYLDFLLKVYREVTARGRTMQFWGDIIVQHPDLIPELPKDVIALEWGYEAHHPFDAHGAQFEAAGIPFYVCPGTSSWNSIAGRTDNALGNLLNAAENGLQNGAAGYLITDWGDNGHWQVLPVSYLGLAAGAAYAWALDAGRDLDVASAVSRFAFDDPSGSMGLAVYSLGNVYRAVGVEPHNSSALFWMLQWPIERLKEYQSSISIDTLRAVLARIDQAMAPLASARSTRPDAELIRQEFESTARLLRHACRRGLFALGAASTDVAELDADVQEIIHEYKQVWLARNRPGGLADSVSRLEAVRADYARWRAA